MKRRLPGDGQPKYRTVVDRGALDGEGKPAREDKVQRGVAKRNKARETLPNVLS